MNRQESYTFIVMGKTGAGKSSILNSLVGSKKFPEGEDLESKTKEVKEYKGKLKYDVDNSIFSIIDTPGFYDTHGEDNNHIKNLVQFFKSLKEFGGLNCVFFVIPLTDQRFDHTIQTCLHLLKSLLGDDLFKMLKIIYTYKNNLTPLAFKRSVERFKDLPQLLITSGYPVNENLETFIYDYDQPEEFCKNIQRSVKNSPKFYPEVIDHLQNIDFNIDDPIQIYKTLMESSTAVASLSKKIVELEKVIKTHEIQCEKFESERKKFYEDLKNKDEEIRELMKSYNEASEENKKEIMKMIESFEKDKKEIYENNKLELEKMRVTNVAQIETIQKNHERFIKQLNENTEKSITNMAEKNQRMITELQNQLVAAMNRPPIIIHGGGGEGGGRRRKKCCIF